MGLSNYDALDDEDDWYDSYHDEEENEAPEFPFPKAVVGPKAGDSEEKEYYTDWNLRDADDGDVVDSPDVDGLPPELIPAMRPPSPPEGRTVELLKEEEREQKIISGFLNFA